MTFNELRQKYPVFEYKSFSHKIVDGNLVCSWEMLAGDLKYNPMLTIHHCPENFDKSGLDNLVFHLGIADMFSYWKPTCSPLIRISAGHLNSDQIAWWHDLLIKGMGQYFFSNNIDFRDPNFVKIESSGPKHEKAKGKKTGILIPMGGGKDSTVTTELLKNNGNVSAFSQNITWSNEMSQASRRILETAGIEEIIFAKRNLDPILKDLARQGFLNGHIPITAYMLFLSALIAEVFAKKDVVFSSERSSNEGNLEYLGFEINHQYSKSFAFETLFRQYCQAHLSNVNIFSFLRPLYELQIMYLFSQPQMEKYYTHFRSCNVGYKTNSWCGSCPKCLSVFVGLFPFMKTEKLVEIFGRNLFEDQKLLPLRNDVLGIGNSKPFECIGTFDETKVAFYLSVKKLKGQKLPPLLDGLEEILGNLDSLSQTILHAWDDQNHLPTKYVAMLKKNLPK